MATELIDRHTGRTTGFRYTSRDMSGPLPPILYKYLRLDHATAMVDRGELMFSTLSWFQNLEDTERGDEFEGTHKYFPVGGLEVTRHERDGKPHPPVTFTRPNDSLQSKAKGRDHIFIFSTALKPGLTNFSDGKSRNASVEIHDPVKFLAQLRRRLDLLPRAKVATLIHDQVRYYSFGDPPGNTYALPDRLTMHKHDGFLGQSEYRFAFGTKRDVFDFQHVDLAIVPEGARLPRVRPDPAVHRLKVTIGSLAACCRLL
jgi:hypothetical protein